MQRLTKRGLTKREGNHVYINADVIPRSDCKGEYGFDFCSKGKDCINTTNRKCPILRVLDKLAEYEDKEERGLIIVPPCNVGDKVYKISRNKVKECEVVFIGISADDKCSYFNFVENYADGTFYKSYSMVFGVIGKTVFLTKEEAEAKLKEGERE